MGEGLDSPVFFCSGPGSTGHENRRERSGLAYRNCPADFCPGADCPVALSPGPKPRDLQKRDRDPDIFPV